MRIVSITREAVNTSGALMNRNRGRIAAAWAAGPKERAPEAGSSGEFVASVEWVRLPGLFRWREVCDVARQIQEEDEWCFAVRQVSVGPHSEPLYVVDAGTRRRTRTN